MADARGWWRDQTLTVTELSVAEVVEAEWAATLEWRAELEFTAAVSSFAQAKRVAGLQFGNLEEGKVLQLHGVFKQDPQNPVANGRPHYSTAAGGHLYYNVAHGKWLLNAGGFSPDGLNCTAHCETLGAVPAGNLDMVWRYYDGTDFVERTLSVTELSAAAVAKVDREVAVAAAEAAASSFAQADRSMGLQLASPNPNGGKDLLLHGLFTRDAESPDVNGRPHYSRVEGGHLFYSTDKQWLLKRNEFYGTTPDSKNYASYYRTEGEVPVGQHEWYNWDGDNRSATAGMWVAC